MTSPVMTRRVFVANLARATLGFAVVGLAACTSDGADTTTRPDTTGAETTTSAPPRFAWERVDLGFVSAYVVTRAGEGAIIDTGVAGSVGDIEAVLTGIGLAWDDVGHVVVTHRHPDHVGSLDDVFVAAADAVGYAGAGDIPAITAARELVAVGDGDSVLGMDVVETPGHTPGHISLHDPESGLLIAGDALNGSGGGVTGPNPEFSDDMAAANRSVVELAGLTYDTVVFGHGEPVLTDGSELVAELAAELSA
jgi:glyoxylase-like metal-dependent hydrolase (beta-lactamase superfamily II)